MDREEQASSGTAASGTAASLSPAGGSLIAKMIVVTFLVPVLIFGAAGRIDWPAAWIYTALRVGLFLVPTAWLARSRPELVNERASPGENVKRWDVLLIRAYLPFAFGVGVVAGLDAGRYGWSSMPIWLQAIGFAGVVFGHWLPFWAMATNPFFSSHVRIQDDRGHEVVSSGPYRYVRHPGYVGTIVIWFSTGLCLGSWWSLVPAAAIGVLFVARTYLEDRTLLEELPGYVVYAEEVPSRLAPHVW